MFDIRYNNHYLLCQKYTAVVTRVVIEQSDVDLLDQNETCDQIDVT